MGTITLQQCEEQITQCEEQISILHSTLEGLGVNSKGTCDIFGRRFELPVDSEHKAIRIGLREILTNVSNPHMRAFHASWFGFFSSFFSTFAPAALMPYISADLKLTAAQTGEANVASVAGTIVFRLGMGWICEKMGARKGLGFLLLLVCPAIICFIIPGVVVDASGFIVCRCVIGCGLGCFVACQVWCTQMFSKSVVGAANATAAGWGNLGGGVTNLTMPVIFLGFLSIAGEDVNKAWRLCFIVPLAFHIIGAAVVLTGRDLPDGNYAELEKSGAKQTARSSVAVVTGATNVNAWILTITYGFCFGVELTMNNVAATYFYTDFGVTPQLAGVAAAMFGLMNLFARSLGGIASDSANAKFGMRGRVWALWIIQMLEGALCIILGAITMNMDAPYPATLPMVPAYVNIPVESYRLATGLPTGWTPLNAPGPQSPSCAEAMMVLPCGSLSAQTTASVRACLGITDTTILVQDPPLAFGGTSDNCISHSNSFGLAIVIVIIFSLFVQMAEGATFGIVPYVSRPALGIINGMVGAGGNAGAVIAQSIFFRGTIRTDRAIVNLGILVLCVTMLLFGIYFPDSGGMLFKKGSLKYNPQLVKPPADYRGADSMDYANVKLQKKPETEEGTA